MERESHWTLVAPAADASPDGLRTLGCCHLEVKVELIGEVEGCMFVVVVVGAAAAAVAVAAEPADRPAPEVVEVDMIDSLPHSPGSQLDNHLVAALEHRTDEVVEVADRYCSLEVAVGHRLSFAGADRIQAVVGSACFVAAIGLGTEHEAVDSMESIVSAVVVCALDLEDRLAVDHIHMVACRKLLVDLAHECSLQESPSVLVSLLGYCSAHGQLILDTCPSQVGCGGVGDRLTAASEFVQLQMIARSS